MLSVENLDIFYGGIHAVKNISFEVPQGKIVTLIGANGAGKTSTLRAISGLLKIKSGNIQLNKEKISGKTANKIVECGVVMSPEGRRVFADFSVEENLLIGAYIRKDSAGIQADIKSVYKLFPRLEERQKQRAGNLSGGEQQMLALGRALMSKPKLLMLDEPSLGIAPIVCEDIFNTIKTLNQEEGITILLVEQNAKRALELSHYAYVLESGRILFDGTGKDLLQDVRVQSAYLSD